MHLFSILDQTEDPTPTDIAKNALILNDLLRNEQADAACQYLIGMTQVTLPPGVARQYYTFSIGTGSAAYLVQKDAVAVRQIWLNDVNLTVNRTTRIAPKSDVMRTTYPGIITKWHQERQIDGSVLVYAWQPPNRAVPCTIEYGGRVPEITGGNSIVALPPEGIHDATLLLGRRIYKSYGVVPGPTDIIFADAERVNNSWRSWARGQQWLQLVRS